MQHGRSRAVRLFVNKHDVELLNGEGIELLHNFGCGEVVVSRYHLVNVSSWLLVFACIGLLIVAGCRERINEFFRLPAKFIRSVGNRQFTEHLCLGKMWLKLVTGLLRQ